MATNSIKGPRGVELLAGETITLAASAARTTGANGSWIPIMGERQRIAFLCDITASATDAGDTADIYVDVSFDGTNSAGNAIHFTQHAGNGAAIKEWAVLDPTAGAATVTDVTTDAASGAVRPYLFGAYYRARWAVADSGDGNSSVTFSVTGYAI